MIAASAAPQQNTSTRRKRRKPWTPRDPTERELWIAYRSDSSPAHCAALVEHYSEYFLASAQAFARKLPTTATFDVDDLYQRAMQVLFAHIIPRFDHRKGYAFKTFATLRIRGAMLDLLREQDPVSRVSRQKRDDNPQTFQFVSLEAQDDNGKKTPFAHTLVDHREPNADERLNSRAAIQCAVRGLSKRENLLIQLYYSADMTMKQIGLALGMSESRVSQMHKEILIRLREQGESLKETLA